jgi:YidC/Oxa1 family membrane protein insertase
MFSPSETENILNLNQGFNLFGLNLLATPKNSPFESFIWLVPVFCLIIQILTTYFSQKMQGPQPMQANQGCMKLMMYGLPIVFVWLSLGIPAAVGVYWICSGLMDFAQRLIIMKFYNNYAIAAKQEAARIERRLIEEKNW